MTTTARQTEGLIINGERVEASDGETFDVFDPSTGERLATVAKATKADVDRAVQSAQAALESKAWGGLAPAERGRIMNRIAQRDPRARRGAGDAREPRQRQAAAPGAHRRAGGRALLRVLRRHRRQDHGQHDPARPRLSRLHGARADRRVGADRAVELSDSDRRARRRAGARRRLHGRAQAVERSADDGAAARRDRRSRAGCRPACSTSFPAPDRKPAPRWRAIPTSTSSRSPDRSTSASRSRRWRPRTSCRS